MTRMFCVDCGHTAFARTRWPGSDAVESIGWLLGGLPGWLFCAWRHALRTKHCAVCGSVALARETRASAARQPCEAPRFPPTSGDGRMWPAHLRDPRERLQRGFVCIVVWVLLAVGPPQLAVCSMALWLTAEGAFAARRHVSAPRAGAWDARGRALHIEIA